MPKSIELRRAERARHLTAGVNGDFKNSVEEFSLRVATCGLLSALYYLNVRGEKHEHARVLLQFVMEWLIRSNQTASLRHATTEAQQLGVWLRLLAKSPATGGLGNNDSDRSGNIKEELNALLGSDTGAFVFCQKKGMPTWHPGLYYDKLVPPAEQVSQKDSLERLARLQGDNACLQRALRVHEQLAKVPRGQHFKAALISPLAAHLARTGPLENAALCMHPLYGFAYLPGSGIKGMARAYAEMVWLPKQSDKKQAWDQIKKVFGWAPGDDELTGKDQNERKPWAPPKPEKDDPHAGSCSGAVVFHDALPQSWPKLVVDVAAVHHPKYYRGKGDPGDHEGPNPVTFLTAAPGIDFSFVLTPALPTTTSEHMQLARVFLAGALQWLGAGAKTNAGYGAFKVADLPQAAIAPENRKEYQLELITPAYLAGSQQGREDCQLRVPTLRGQLRWWWRTLHAAHLSGDDLRQLEGAIWGTTERASPIRLTLEPVGAKPVPAKSAFMELAGSQLVLDSNFERDHGVVRREGPKTVQPLYYMSYGVDVAPTGAERKQRHFLPVGSKWRLEAHFQNNKTSDFDLKVSDLLREFEAALWLFCRFGGVGTRSRRAFGSLEWVAAGAESRLVNIQRDAEGLRKKLNLRTASRPSDSPQLSTLQVIEAETEWMNSWFAIDQLGFIYQSFCEAPTNTGHGKHCVEKSVLGLPRKKHKDGPSFDWGAPHNDRRRFASPIHFHIGKGKEGKLVARIAIVPSPSLPQQRTAQRILDAFKKHAEEKLATLKNEAGSGITNAEIVAASTGVAAQRAQQSARAQEFHVGGQVEVEILVETTKKGGRVAKVCGTDFKGIFMDEQNAPADAPPGSRHTVTIKVRTDKASDTDRWQLLWKAPPQAPAGGGKKGGGPNQRGGPGPYGGGRSGRY